MFKIGLSTKNLFLLGKGLASEIVNFFLLLESGDFLLQENGDKVIL